MRKLVVLGFMVALFGVPLKLAAAEMGGDSSYCAKHCSAMQLKTQVKNLEKKIVAEKTAASSPSSAGKLATVMAEKEKAQKHLGQHIKELEDLKADLSKAEYELK